MYISFLKFRMTFTLTKYLEKSSSPDRDFPLPQKYRLVGLVVKASASRADRLVGLVVKASASRAEGPGFESRLRRDFFGVESYQ